MKINLNTPLVNLAGAVLPGEIQGTILVAKDVIISALLGQTNEKIGGFTKHQCYLTYKKIIGCEDGNISLTSEEITTIKALVDKYYGTIIVGQIYDLFQE